MNASDGKPPNSSIVVLNYLPIKAILAMPNRVAVSLYTKGFGSEVGADDSLTEKISARISVRADFIRPYIQLRKP
ncbi:MAG: hypothetical protein NZ805_07250 [Armatimonadetes bacterium]|nr:hypothetical protein [Armatimonadota bacterium]